MTTRPGDRHVLHPGDKVMKIGDYNIPGEVRCRFIMTTGVVRYAVEHKAEGGGRFVHIYADKNLELVERGFEGKREDASDADVEAGIGGNDDLRAEIALRGETIAQQVSEITRLREALEAAVEALGHIPDMRGCLHEAWFSSVEDAPSASSAENEVKSIESIALDAVAKALAALGKPSVTEPQAGPHPPTP